MVVDEQLITKCRTALSFAAGQLRHLIRAYPDFFPMYTHAGKWTHGGEVWTNWCEGFLCGQLWLLHRYTREDWWRERAIHYCRLMEPRKADRNVHDLGFLFWPSWKRWYDLSGEQDVKNVVVEAGRTMGLRYQERGRYLQSFLSADSLFIDIMMNIGIVFYAARQINDENLWRVACDHCLTTRRFLVRGDGSTAHEGIFDTQSGEFIRQSTQQGWRPDSSWARGQAWALYGFGTAYACTGDAHFLQTAQSCADYYIERTPVSGVPPNDWDEPHPAHPYESSAAAVAASGLLNLASLCGDVTQAQRYHGYALRIIETLLDPLFLASNTPGWEGILMHGVYHERKHLGVDESVMWGDYFLLEALLKVIGEIKGLDCT